MNAASPRYRASISTSALLVGQPKPYRDPNALVGESNAASSDEAVKVLCRVRPFNPREVQLHQQATEGKPQWERAPLRSIVEFKGNTCVLYNENSSEGYTERERFTFDGCMWSIPPSIQESDNEYVSQETVFDLYGRDMLAEVWKGFNTCFFAYGQTGSGKTYSMIGEEENQGFIPRLGQCLFDQIEEVLLEAEQEGNDSVVRQFRVEVRYLEIYNEMVKDLLWPLSPLAPEMKAKLNPENLKIRSTPATGVFVEGLTGVEVDSWKRMAELIDLGNVSRSVASTKMNERSSRSHAIFKITLSQSTTSVPKKQFEKPTTHLRTAQINLVDLAGSERNKKTGATGDRLKEAASINRSLMCLKQVIDALVDNSQISKAANKKRVPYRDSHLTSILMDSLGGNAKTWMLVCISPHADNAEETHQTLRYGARARKIVNTVHVNENASARLMLDLEDELERLKAELASSSEASMPEAVDALNAQIEAHEAAIRNIEQKVEEQKSLIAALEAENEKSAKVRHQAAMANLSIVMQARLQRDHMLEELQQKLDNTAALRESLVRLQADIANMEAETTRSNDEAARLRAAAAQMDAAIDEVKKKNVKLESQRRSLTKSLEEGEQLVKSLAHERFATILKARLQVARLNIEFRRKQEDCKTSGTKRLDAMKEAANARERNLDAEVQKELTTTLQTLSRYKTELGAVRHEEEKFSAEKTSQANTLQQEVAHLQQELRRKRESHQQKLAQMGADWDKKLSTLTLDMERQLQRLTEEFERKKRELEEERDERKASLNDDFERNRQRLQQEHDQRIMDAHERGVADARTVEEEWNAVLSEKRKQNDVLREKLRDIAVSVQKYCERQYRIATSMDLLVKAKVSRRLSVEAKQIAADALEFHALFEDNRPDKVKLDHLIKANLTLRRCSAAPVLGEGEDGESVRAKSPSARSQTPIRFRRPSTELSQESSGSVPRLSRASLSTSPRTLHSLSPKLYVN